MHVVWIQLQRWKKFTVDFWKKLNEVEFDLTFKLSLEYNSLESVNYINIAGYAVDISRLGETIGVTAWEAKEAQGFWKTW